MWASYELYTQSKSSALFWPFGCKPARLLSRNHVRLGQHRLINSTELFWNWNDSKALKAKNCA